MLFDEFQFACRRTAKIETPKEKRAHALEGLISELGEISDTIKKHNRYGKSLDVDNIREELGDVLYYCAMLADSINESLGSCARENVEKLQKRYPDAFSEFHAAERLDKKSINDATQEDWDASGKAYYDKLQSQQA